MDITENDLLQALLDAYPTPVRPDEVTGPQMAREWQCSLHTSRNRLEGMVSAGKLARRTAIDVNGHPVTAYSKAGA